jgi:hypothetical protein
MVVSFSARRLTLRFISLSIRTSTARRTRSSSQSISSSAKALLCG